jgi:type VI secretion system protein ImpB
MELPFVVGIMANLSSKEGVKDKDGKPVPLRDRKYMEIDRDNFNDIMTFCKPSVNGGSTKYTFESLEDFTPARLLKPTNEKLNTVDPDDTSPLALARVDYERRTLLSDMVAKLDGNVPLQTRFLEELRKNDGRELKETVQGIKAEAASASLPSDSQTSGSAATSEELSEEEKAVAAAKKELKAKEDVLTAKKKEKVDLAQKEVDRELEELKAAQDKLKKEKG